MNGIPKIIHQIWPYALPTPSITESFASKWKAMHPEWEYVYWDRQRLDAFWREYYPRFKNCDRAAVAQYFILKHFGGVYAAVDLEPVKAMDGLFESGRDCYLSMEGSSLASAEEASEERSGSVKAHAIGNNHNPDRDSENCAYTICESFVAAAPGSGFIDYAVKICLGVNERTVWSGNFADLSELYAAYDDKKSIEALPAKYFQPLSRKETGALHDGQINAGELEVRLSQSVAICHFFYGPYGKKSTDIMYASTGNRGGGAWIAAHRIHQGLVDIGLRSRMLVKSSGYPPSDNIVVASYADAQQASWHSRESEAMKGYVKNNRNVLFSPSISGIDLKRYLAEHDPKIFQLHWIHSGFLSIEQLKEVKVPIVWRLPDVWAFTGGCDYFGNCDGYTRACGKCPLFSSSDQHDITNEVWERKIRSWEGLDMTIVVPSQWMKDAARRSSLFANKRIELIPNGVDVNKFRPRDKESCQRVLEFPPDKKILLFGASNALSNRRKGFFLLKEALRSIPQQVRKDYCLALFGTNNLSSSDEQRLSSETGVQIKNLGTISDHLTLMMAYSAADTMIVPSLEEAFGQTVIEAMSCSTPVISFLETGPASIVDHMQNGYLARYMDAGDLAKGILWTLGSNERIVSLSRNARYKVETTFDIRRVAHQYKKLYEELLRRNR